MLFQIIFGRKITNDLKNIKTWKIDSLETKVTKRAPLGPYTTSTLQQDANRYLGYSAKQTMSLAQKLYEGMEYPKAKLV